MPLPISNSDHFDLSRVVSETFVASVEHHDVLGSTNDRALELVAVNVLDAPLLVLADKQTSGRGRGANAWWSAEGALTFSVIVDAASRGLLIERWPLVSLASGLAVCEALIESVPGTVPRLKWPNDVFLNERKVSGLLVEVPGTRNGRLVIGIGINVNNSLKTGPQQLRETATSLADVAGSRLDRTDVLIKVLQHLDARLSLLGESVAQLLERWREFCLLTGRTVLLRAGADEILGHCRGVDDQGALLLETPAGLRRFQSGVVVHFDGSAATKPKRAP